MNLPLRPSLSQLLPRKPIHTPQSLRAASTTRKSRGPPTTPNATDLRIEKLLRGMVKRNSMKKIDYRDALKDLPPYPYGLNHNHGASNLGLYGGLLPRSGNNVSKITETKTRRKWLPNIQNKRLWSGALGRYVRLRVATRVLRTIDKVGGLDEYVLGEKSARIRELGLRGWVLRWQIMGTDWYKARRKEEAKASGLTEEQLRELGMEDTEIGEGREFGRVLGEKEKQQLLLEASQMEGEEIDREAELELLRKELEESIEEDVSFEERERERQDAAFMAEQPPSEPSQGKVTEIPPTPRQPHSQI